MRALQAMLEGEPSATHAPVDWRTARFLGLERAHALVGRGLDELEAKIDGQFIGVRFLNFKQGAKKEPIA